MSLRWRVVALAMSSVALVVTIIAAADFFIVSLALQNNVDGELRSRAKQLIDSGSLDNDPSKAIEESAYSDVNALLIIPGRTTYKANPEGTPLPFGKAETDVVAGNLLLSLRTVNHQRVLAERTNGNTLILWKSLSPNDSVWRQLGTVLLIVGAVGMALAALAGALVTRARPPEQSPPIDAGNESQ